MRGGLVASVTLPLAAVALLLSLVSAGGGTPSGDVSVASQLQSMEAFGVDPTVATMNWFGRAIPLTAAASCVAALLLYRKLYLEAALLVVAVAVSQLANGALKELFLSPRPDEEWAQAGTRFGGYGFPSGHTMSTLVFCGILVFLLSVIMERRMIWIAAGMAGAIIVAGMGFSRVYVGAHWPSDVLGAYLWGGIMLLVLIAGYYHLASKFRPGGELD